jgi:hypothetical protein
MRARTCPVGAAWVSLGWQGEGQVQPDDRPDPCRPVWMSRRLPILTSCPAACQETRKLHRSSGQACRLKPPPMISV